MPEPLDPNPINYNYSNKYYSSLEFYLKYFTRETAWQMYYVVKQALTIATIEWDEGRQVVVGKYDLWSFLLRPISHEQFRERRNLESPPGFYPFERGHPEGEWQLHLRSQESMGRVWCGVAGDILCAHGARGIVRGIGEAVPSDAP